MDTVVMEEDKHIECFIHLDTGRVINHSGSDNLLLWAYRNPDVLKLPEHSLPRQFNPYSLSDNSRMAKCLVDSGWTTVIANHGIGDYRFLITANTLADAVNISNELVRMGTGRPDYISINSTSDVGHLKLKSNHVAILLDSGEVPEDAFKNKLEHNARLNALLAELSALPSAARIQIFGSFAKGKVFPSDIDLYLDCRTEPSQKGETGELMRLARRYYSCLDPFVDAKKGLFVRNDDAQGWTPAARSKEIRLAVAKDGVPIANLAPLAESFTSREMLQDNSSTALGDSQAQPTNAAPVNSPSLGP